MSSNWRDDARDAQAHAAHAEYEARARSMGQREQTSQAERDSDVQPGRPLPEFRYTPAAERAPTIAAPPAEPAETRMSRAQLRDRIQGMEATTRQKAAEAAAAAAHHYYPGEHRARVEGPVARNARAEKLTAYRAELARKDADAAADQARAAEHRAQEGARRESLDGPSPAQVHTIAAAAAATNPTPAAAAACESMQRAAIAAELPPVPPAAAAELASATARRLAVVADARATSQPALSDLERALDSLMEQWTLGEIIDATWRIDQRRFQGRVTRAKAGAR